MIQMSDVRSNCTVVLNFSIEHISIMSEQFQKDDVVVLTNNKNIETELRGLGFTAKYLNNYFEEGSREIFAIQDEAVKRMSIIKQSMLEMQFQGIQIIEGLKLLVLEDLIFLEKIRLILGSKQNYVFLFDNFSHRYNAIRGIAGAMGYAVDGPRKVLDGRLEVEDTELLSKGFKELLESRLDEDYNLSLSNRIKESLVGVSTAIIDNPKHGFFLVENEEGYYLKPVYPVIEKLRDNGDKYALYCFSERTAGQVIKKEYNINNLSKYIDEIELVVLSKERQFVHEALAVITTKVFDDIILDGYVKTLFNSYIVRSVARTLAVILVIEKILDAAQFSSLVIAADGDPDNDTVCAIAKKYNIPTYGIIPFVKEFTPMFSALYSASKLFVSGPRLKRELQKIGISETRMLVTGSPRYDYLKRNRVVNPTLKNFADSQKKVVLVAPSRIHENDEIWMSELIKSCSRTDTGVFVKLHPMYQFKKDLLKSVNEKIEYIVKECQGLKYHISFDGEIADFLELSDVLVTDYSSVVLEASLKDLPVVIFTRNKKEPAADYFLSFQDEGIALLANNEQELFENLQTILMSKDDVEGLANKREMFNFEFNYLNDGNASERVYRILTGKSQL